MFDVRQAGDHLYGESLFAWLSLLVSLMVSYFVLSFFPRDVLGEIWDCQQCPSENMWYFFFLTVCHKNRMTTRVITLWRVHLISLKTSLSTMRCLTEIILALKAINIIV